MVRYEGTVTEAYDADQDDPLALRTLLRRLAVGFAVLLVVLSVVFVLAAEPLRAISERFVDQFGLVGVFVGCMLIDATPGLTHEPVLVVARQGGIPFWAIFAAAGTGSSLSGVVGYGIGRLIGGSAFVQRLLIRYRLRHFLHRYGTRAVAIAALTPFPFAIATWGSGASQVPLRSVIIGSLFRYPKVLFYLSGIAGVIRIFG